MEFIKNQKINHHTFGEGIINEIIERTWEKDQTTEPIILVEFKEINRIVRFTKTSLGEHIS